jgi:uncharacterized lipoprotein
MKGQARWLAALACVIALTAGCSNSSEPRSGSNQQHERDNEPSGMRGGGGGGGGY